MTLCGKAVLGHTTVQENRPKPCLKPCWGM